MPSKVFLEEEEDTIGILVSRLWWMWIVVDVDWGGCGQQFKQIQHQENKEQVQDLMIHHAPVELGGGPKLQLLSKPDPEVKIYHLSAAYNLLPQITAQEGQMLSLECEVAGLRPIGKISLPRRSAIITSIFRQMFVGSTMGCR